MKLPIHKFALFDLLKIALWNKQPEQDYALFSDADWQAVYRLAIEQGVRGPVFEGIIKLKEEVQPNEELMLTWAANIKYLEERRNHNTNTLLCIREELAQKGIDMLLLKGKSLAEFFPTPAYREYGDIDIFLFGKWKEGDAFFKEKGTFIKDTPKHAVFTFQGVSVENHRRFIDLVEERNIFNKKRYDAFEKVEQLLHEILADEPHCTLQDYDVRVPSPTFNFLFLLMHAGVHLGDELAVRHLCDWACFLAANKGKYDEQRILEVLNLLNFHKWSFLFIDLSVHLLGMPQEYVPLFRKLGGEKKRRKKEEERLIKSLFYHYPKPNEVKRNTWWHKWKRFYHKQWRFNLFDKEYLPERLMRTIVEWYRKKQKKRY